uniref:Uncharacterized protein n=1 Tax=Arundo donax TaxID=35708 RepID=A0A0A8YDT3_ARUDO
MNQCLESQVVHISFLHVHPYKVSNFSI